MKHNQLNECWYQNHMNGQVHNQNLSATHSTSSNPNFLEYSQCFNSCPNAHQPPPPQQHCIVIVQDVQDVCNINPYQLDT